MGIQVTNKQSKMPKGLKLASSILSYLFEEQYGECEYMKESEKGALRKAISALTRTSNRTIK